jgi:hypothetical protein
MLCFWCVAGVVGIAFPSTEVLARDYLEAVIDKDAEAAAATSLTSDAGCQTITLEDAHKDIDEFGGTDVQDVTVIVVPNIYGSDDGIEVAEMIFRYRKSGEANWQDGKMRLMTDGCVIHI